MHKSVLVALFGAVQASKGPSPISKVQDLLAGLESKIIREGEDALKVFNEASEMCEDRSRRLRQEIKVGSSTAEELTASIGQDESTVAELESKLQRLASDIASNDADLKAAGAIRAKEAKSFAAEEKEFVEVIDTLRRAIAVLEREMRKGSSMLQMNGITNIAQAMDVLVNGAMLSVADGKRLTALAQTNNEDSDFVQPEAAVYQSKSGGIVETLSDLLDKAQDQLESARKQETQNLHAYELMQQSLQDEIKFSNKDRDESEAAKFAAGERKAKSEGSLSMTQKDLKADNKALEELHHRCMTTSQDYQEQTKIRGEELKAIKDAKQVLQDTVAGASDVTYGSNAASFLQTATSITDHASLVHFEAARLVRDLARKEQSTELSQLATRMSSAIRASSRTGEDPFAKVKGLIQNMLEKLEKEALQDADKKQHCDKELAEANAKKTIRGDTVEKLSTQIDKLKARSAQLKEEVAFTQQGLADLARTQAEMDKIRSEERELFVKNKADLELGLKGVKQALKVLTEYYAQGTQTQGAADGGRTSIIGLLEVVESDFTKNLAEMKAAEDASSSAHEEDTNSNSVQRTMKEGDVKYNTRESAELDKTVSEVKSDRSNTQVELDAVSEYLKKLEEQCIAKAESYSERQSRFQAELAGLKEALRILASETAFVQMSSSHKMRGSRTQAVLRAA